jgi:hypothetical protein
MTEEGFDVYPIVHGGKVYNLVTHLDLSFTEVHALLDRLAERGAFGPSGLGAGSEEGSLFRCDLPDATFDVDVQGLDVVVIRRTPA